MASRNAEQHEVKYINSFISVGLVWDFTMGDYLGKTTEFGKVARLKTPILISFERERDR